MRRPPPLVSPNDFVRATDRQGIFGSTPSRQSLEAIDAALVAYAAVPEGEDGVDRGAAALAAIVEACADWIVQAKAGLFRGSPRRDAVKALGDQAFARWQAVSFSENKAFYRGGQLPPATRDVGDRFEVERRLYEASGKQTRPMPGAMFMGQAFAHNRSAMEGDGLAAIAAKGYHALSGDELMTFERWAAKRGDEVLSLRVRFMNKATRTRHLVEVMNGKLFTGFMRPLSDGGGEGNMRGDVTLYALDVYGNLFCCTDNPAIDGCLQHSSYNAGKTVICAGILRMRDGILLGIDNDSGHYKPTRDNLHAARRPALRAGDPVRPGPGPGQRDAAASRALRDDRRAGHGLRREQARPRPGLPVRGSRAPASRRGGRRRRRRRSRMRSGRGRGRWPRSPSRRRCPAPGAGRRRRSCRPCPACTASGRRWAWGSRGSARFERAHRPGPGRVRAERRDGRDSIPSFGMDSSTYSAYALAAEPAPQKRL